MSPYLLIICMERLSRDINRKVEDKSWSPIKNTNSSPKISHLFFADVLRLFARVNTLNCNTITQTLHDFCLKSGQSVRHNKYKVVFSSNYTTQMVSHCSNLININPSSVFGKYMEFPIFHNKPTHNDF